MRRALAILIAGFALAAAFGSSGPSAGADTIVSGTNTYTSKTPIYNDQKVLEPLPSGARASPDRQLPHSNTAAYVLLGVVAFVSIGALLFWLATNALAIEPRWLTDGRHAFAEVGWRAANTWDEFKDWLRLGR
jgi:hypothetical protein